MPDLLRFEARREGVLKNDGMFPTGLLIQSLNEMIDDQEKRLTALVGRVPNIVLTGRGYRKACAGAGQFETKCGSQSGLDCWSLAPS